MGVQKPQRPGYCLTLAQCLQSTFYLLHLRDRLRNFGRDVSPAIRSTKLPGFLIFSANRWAPNTKLTLAEKEAKAGKAYTELEHTYNDLPSFMRLTSSPRVIRAAHHYSFQLVTSLFSFLLTRPLASIPLTTSSLQYFSTVILLHRPFLRSHKEHDPLDKLTFDLSAHHHRVCTFAADKISSIMKLYQSSYTLVGQILR